MNHTKKGYRIVVIDLAGTVINDRGDLDQAFKTLRSAEKEFEKVCGQFDGTTILKNALEIKRKEAARSLSDIDAQLIKLSEYQEAQK